MKANLSKAEISGPAMPFNWTYCFNGQCPRSGDCLRFLTGEAVPDSITSGQAVFPNALNGGNCPYYHLARKVRMAWGFRHLFDTVRVADVKLVRDRMTRLLKGVTNYYRYNHGKKRLSPEQQEEIRKIFAEYGYVENIEFDQYEEAVDFG